MEKTWLGSTGQTHWDGACAWRWGKTAWDRLHSMGHYPERMVMYRAGRGWMVIVEFMTVDENQAMAIDNKIQLDNWQLSLPWWRRWL